MHLCLAVLLARGTDHTARLRLSGCTRSSFLCDKHCAIGMIIWKPLMDTGAISTAALQNCAAELCFPKGRDVAVALSLCISNSCTTQARPIPPSTVSLCSSHQTRPRVPADDWLTAFEVPSFVLSIYALDVGHDLMWNVLQDIHSRATTPDGCFSLAICC